VPGIGLIKAFLEHASADGSRSTVLKPLGWLLLICVGAILSVLYMKGPTWIVILFFLAIGIIIILYLFTFIYCLFTDKDALRTEKYSIQKLAIEKGFVGDDIFGQLDPDQAETQKLLGESSVVEAGEDR